MKTTTNGQGRKLPIMARQLLREFGVQAGIARRLSVNRSTVSRVLAGKKTSARVRKALLSEAARLAKLAGMAAALEFEEDGKGAAAFLIEHGQARR